MDLKIPEKVFVANINLERGLIIYGAGRTGRLIYDWLDKYKIKCQVMLDQNLAGEYKNAHIHRFPQDVLKDWRSIPVLLALHDGVLEAYAGLKQQGFELIITLAQLYLYLENNRQIELPVLGPLGQLSKQLTAGKRMQAAYELLADDISRINFQQQLNYRFMGEAKYIASPDAGLQYYPDNRPFEFKAPIKFVDCGAFDGDTIRDLLTVVKFSEIFAFEPDQLTFSRLRKFLDEKKLSFPVITLQSGVGEHNDVLPFASGQDGAATFSEQGKSRVSVMALDTLFSGTEVDFIKMDIEGSEAAALQGAAKLIKQAEPVLAVSVYHQPSDLWEIPILIKQLNPNYKIYLRTHRGSYHDTVCYAVPDKFRRP